MNPIVLSSLIPVVLLIAIGLIAKYAGFMRSEAAKDLSMLVFNVLTPALLFRTMSTVHPERLDFKPVAAYFAAALLMMALVLLLRGLNRRAVVLALAASFSNTVAIGIPLIGLAFGQAGLVTLLPVISLHALILLTLATVLLEVAVAREAPLAPAATPRHTGWVVLGALRSGLIHPVPLPIILGLLFAQTGWTMPEVVDRPLLLLGNAMGPLALLLVGVNLAGARVGVQLKAALRLTLLKNLALPALMAGLGLLLGLHGVPLAVMVVTAALPTGANVFMFSQRYEVAQELVTATMAVSTGLSLLTISLVMAAVAWL
jgi:malonate transporter and related proteins